MQYLTNTATEVDKTWQNNLNSICFENKLNLPIRNIAVYLLLCSYEIMTNLDNL